MDRDMLLLAERLVVAMETISQDVRNMSAYVYDISCYVSHLLNEKGEKECFSFVAYDNGDKSASVTSAARQEVSVEGEYSGPYEQADERLSLDIADLEQKESSFGDIACTSIDPRGNSDVLSSESNSISTDGIKIEEQSEDDIHDEPCDVRNIAGHSRNVDGFLKEIESHAHITIGPDEACGMHTTVSNYPGQWTPSAILKTIRPEQEIQHIGTINNPAVHSEYVTSVIQAPGGQARAQEVEITKDTSMVHMRVNSGERPYKCSVCEKSFNVRRDLLRHSLVHSGERPYKCNVCGKAFRQNIHLTLHMRSHTGEKPHKCSLCGKSFSRSTTLIFHMRSHTGEKPYKCTFCEKAFSSNQCLKEHELIHTGEKPYICTVCGKLFRYHSNLSQHMHTHAANLPFQ